MTDKEERADDGPCAECGQIRGSVYHRLHPYAPPRPLFDQDEEED